MDDRNMKEIHVTWQLGLFIAALFGLPISLAPIYTAMTDQREVPRTVLNISCSIAAAFLLAMVIAVWSRVRQAKSEQRPDGTPMSAWVVRQVLIGLVLCIAGAGIFAIVIMFGAPTKVAAIGCTIAAGPGVIFIGRALAPAAATTNRSS